MRHSSMMAAGLLLLLLLCVSGASGVAGAAPKTKAAAPGLAWCAEQERCRTGSCAAKTGASCVRRVGGNLVCWDPSVKSAPPFYRVRVCSSANACIVTAAGSLRCAA